MNKGPRSIRDPLIIDASSEGFASGRAVKMPFKAAALARVASFGILAALIVTVDLPEQSSNSIKDHDFVL